MKYMILFFLCLSVFVGFTSKAPLNDQKADVFKTDWNYEVFQEILLNEAPFIYDGEEECYLNEFIYYEEEDIIFPVIKFAVIDLDNDGSPEVVLEAISLGMLVLHYENGKVYGFYFWHRSFQMLKRDGTFNQTGGAVYNRIVRLTFSDGGYEEHVLCETSPSKHCFLTARFTEYLLWSLDMKHNT